MAIEVSYINESEYNEILLQTVAVIDCAEKVQQGVAFLYWNNEIDLYLKDNQNENN